MTPIVINARVIIPESAIEVQFVRSGGPGGQNVNKVATKVRMWIDLAAVPGFRPEELERVRAALRSRLDARGRLAIASDATRDQARNVEDAVSRAAQLIRAALVPPKVRRATRPPRSVAQSRLRAKRHRAARLRERRIEES